MKRLLRNLLTALSLLLCVAVAALWVRSYRATDTMRINASREARIVFTRGAAVLATRPGDPRADDQTPQISVAFGAHDQPREPDYDPDPSYRPPPIVTPRGGGWAVEPGEVGPPPGPGWIAKPFDSFRTVRLGILASALVVLPAVRLLLFRRDRHKPPRERESTPQRTFPGSSIARAMNHASAIVLMLALAGWIDSATWHG